MRNTSSPVRAAAPAAVVATLAALFALRTGHPVHGPSPALFSFAVSAFRGRL